jgi:predicted Rossmann-fold nucleotide-binding protein
MKQKLVAANYADWLSTATECKNLVFQALDLSGDDQKLSSLPQATTPNEACVFLGCNLGPSLANLVVHHHGLVFPEIPGLPFLPFRHELYSVEELFRNYDPAKPPSYLETPDWQTYKSFIKVDAQNKPLKPVQFVEVGLSEMLAHRLHDTFIEQALEEFLDGFRGAGKKGIVAIMGGHDKKRSDPEFKRVASLARTLTLEGYLIASGGGPGFMEAANLGAFFASQKEATMYEAINSIAIPDQSDVYSDKGWLSAAWNLRNQFLPKDWSLCRSLGIPTWFYGHEPPNVFSSHIAKYFENSLREEGLLAIATHGVVFAEGNGGTIQEIFQDACQNYYENYGFKSPMILFSKDYWNPKPLNLTDGYPVYPEKVYPAWPLLQGLAQKKNFTSLLTLTSDTDEVLAAIKAFPDPW